MTAPFYALIVPQPQQPPEGGTPSPGAQQCGNCDAFLDGHCHLAPPTVLMTAPVGGATAGDAKSFWPEVRPEDWCAQWRLMT